MNVLDSPLEVFLALDYMGFGLLTVVNNVWTWVAVITAAVSVWRIRSSSPRDHFPSEVSLMKPGVASSPVERLAAPDEPAESTPAKVEVKASRPSPCLFNSEGRTSGKFTFYYVREDDEEEANVDGDGDGDGDGDVDGVDGNEERKIEPVRNGWEVMVEMRMGDHMGFYRYQDLTVLDGNVVRLWDGCRRRNVINAVPDVRRGGYDWSS